MIGGVGIGDAFGAGVQSGTRGAADSLRAATARAATARATTASAPPPEEPFSRPRAPGPVEANGPTVWGNGYLSPVYRFDGSTSTLFYEQRAFVSGDTTRQVPLESAVKLYQLFEQVRQNPPPGQSGEGAGNGNEVDDTGAQAAPPPAAAGETPEAARPPAPGQGDADGGIVDGGIVDGAGENAPAGRQSDAAAGQLFDIVA